MPASPAPVRSSSAPSYTGAPASPDETVVVWLRHDLRLDDHELFDAARTARRVVPLYVFDPAAYGETEWGFARKGPHWTRVLLESLADVQASLRRLGSDLVVRRGPWGETVAEVARAAGASRVLVHAEPMREEADAEAAVEAALPDGCRLDRRWTHTLVHVDDLPYAVADLPPVFTDFRRSVEKTVPIRPLVPAPTALPPLPDGLDAGALPSSEALGVAPREVDPRAAIVVEGGEGVGRRRLEHVVWGSDTLRTYKYTRNRMLGADYSSKFSPWLAHGCLSPRRIAAEVARFEAERARSASTYWMVFELRWRDYFRFWSMRHGDRVFYSGGALHGRRRWRWDPEAFAAWAEGRTGIPLVDANVRELNGTGFMSNRGRQNVASLLVHNLGLDWRAGAAYFEAMLADYDVTSNWGNWSYVAGVGADPRARFFNLVLQSHKYDPDAVYLKHWLPELAPLAPAHAIAPWTRTPEDIAARGVVPGRDYPAPIVDLDATYPRGARVGFGRSTWRDGDSTEAKVSRASSRRAR